MRQTMQQTPADQHRANEVREIFTALERCMCYLSERWADEREYENIADYKSHIEVTLSDLKIVGFTITKMTRRPFGFVATYKGAEYKFKAGARCYEYTRTK
jgi:hypothetical protein